MEGLQPFHPEALLWIAALNPAVIVAGFLMGQRADQWQKLIVVAFVAAIAGAIAVWLGAWFHIIPARGLGGEAGLFVLQMLFGLIWAAIGYWFRRR
jgi:hypothetical protein